MAKRRRLDVPNPEVNTGAASGLETKSITRLSGAPPIADIAGQAAALSAADAAIAEIAAARADGRLVIRVPLTAIDRDHLVRDRLAVDDEEMAALKASIAAHGQRSPVELVEIARAGGGSVADRYGLISGWRRLSALAALYAETGEARFSEALAILRRPEEAGDAYIAMVEENEIRVGLSYYERARIAALAAERGAFADAHGAVDALYAAGSKAKRSKIRGFLVIHDTLGGALKFPADIPERLGLALVQAIKQGQTAALLAALEPGAATPMAEAAALTRAMAAASKAASKPEQKHKPDKDTSDDRSEIIPGVRLSGRKDKDGRVLTLSGPGVTDDLEARLAAFLKTR